MPPEPTPADSPAARDLIALMARETAAREETLPQEVGGAPFPDGGWRFGADWFALGEAGLRFLYRRGDGVAWQSLDPEFRSYVPLYLSGAIYAGVASLNGLFPLHVSAVLHEGQVHAFGGASGAGKSTFVAALAAAGFPLVADDTLLLDLAGEGPPLCLPGHKRLKLTADAFALAGATREEMADREIDKYYASPAAVAPGRPFPLCSLVFLAPGPSIRLERLAPSQRLARLRDDHYTTQMFDGARNLTVAGRFAVQARIARRIEVAVLTRPIDRESFPASVALAARYIRTGKAADSG